MKKNDNVIQKFKGREGVVTGEQDACGGVTTIPSLLRRALSR